MATFLRLWPSMSSSCLVSNSLSRSWLCTGRYYSSRTVRTPGARLLLHWRISQNWSGTVSVRTLKDSSVPPSARLPKKKPWWRKLFPSPNFDHIMALIMGLCFFYYMARIYVIQKMAEKRRKAEQVEAGDLEEFDLYQDPHMSKAALMVKYEGTWIPQQLYVSNIDFENIQDMRVNNEDVFVASFPKSGTTWVQEVVYLIQTDIDVTKAAERTMEERFPYLEYFYPGLRAIQKMPSPRMIKTHLSYHLLPDSVKAGKGKVIYIARNPKDVSVSLYYFVRMFTMSNYRGQFSDFLSTFLEGKVNYGPWWEHVGEFWEHREDANILFLTYEDMHADLPGCIEKIARFLGKSLARADVEKIADLCSFHNMKSNPSANYSWWNDLGLRNKKEQHFMRKGIVGDWKNHFTGDMTEKVQKMIEEHESLRGLNFKDDT